MHPFYSQLHFYLQSNLQKGVVYSWLCSLSGAGWPGHIHVSCHPHPSRKFRDIEIMHVLAEVLTHHYMCWSLLELQNETLGSVSPGDINLLCTHGKSCNGRRMHKRSKWGVFEHFIPQGIRTVLKARVG
jgi:hypothetical protein